MTKTSLPEDNFEIDLDKFESNGMRLMGKSHDPLTSADDLFPKKTISQQKNLEIRLLLALLIGMITLGVTKMLPKF